MQIGQVFRIDNKYICRIKRINKTNIIATLLNYEPSDKAGGNRLFSFSKHTFKLVN